VLKIPTYIPPTTDTANPHIMSCQTMCLTVGLTDFFWGGRGKEGENIVQFTLTLFSQAVSTY